ncbi:hypothetical protein [Streptomyces sp. 1222.5]|uniref:hypothetical protein n=1 Tax=Streptomyces sp. 1222.5 TaxID=1881026 RepID=UPI003D71F26A
MGPYTAAHLIQNSCTAGLAHADALRRLTAAGEVDPTSHWTLLRGALENFATGLWLLDGTGCSEHRSGDERRLGSSGAAATADLLPGAAPLRSSTLAAPRSAQYGRAATVRDSAHLPRGGRPRPE